jgi:hypothetical protein
MSEDIFNNLENDINNVSNDSDGAIDLEDLQNKRSEWGLFRDRREDLYTTVIN